jgi:hypothetical protein
MIATQQPLNLIVNVAGFLPVEVTMQPAQQPKVETTPVPTPKVEMKEEILCRVNLRDFMFKQVGRFVGIDFIKLDGSDRMLNGRLGVRKHLKGGDSTVTGDDKPYLVVYDVKAKGYRAVNLDTVKAVRAQHTRYTITG